MDYVLGSYKGPLGDYRQMFRQIIEGLQFLHLNQIIHRDFNPACIRISIPYKTERLQMKLADFGITRVIDHNRTEFALWRLVGDKSWLSPESYDSLVFTTAMDMFGLGLTLGFALSRGSHPYGDDEEKRVYRIKKKKSMTLTVDQLTEVERGAQRHVFGLIKSLLSTKPSHRPTAEEVLADPFISSSVDFSIVKQEKRIKLEAPSSSKSKRSLLL